MGCEEGVWEWGGRKGTLEGVGGGCEGIITHDKISYSKVNDEGVSGSPQPPQLHIGHDKENVSKHSCQAEHTHR